MGSNLFLAILGVIVLVLSFSFAGYAWAMGFYSSAVIGIFGILAGGWLFLSNMDGA